MRKRRFSPASGIIRCVNVEVTHVDADVPVVLPVEGWSAGGADVRELAWRRALLTFGLTLLGIVFFIGGFAVAYDRMHGGRVLPGVDVAGVQVGGLDRSAAMAMLRARLPDVAAGSLSVRIGDEVGRISYSEIGRDYDIDAIVERALAVGRDGSIIDQLRTLTHGVSVPLQIKWDNAALVSRIDQLTAAASVSPRDATIERSGASYAVVPAVEGRSVDRDGAYLAAVQAVSDLSRTTAEITVATSALPVNVAAPAAQAAIDQLEGVVARPLTLQAGTETYVLSSDMLRGWVRLEPAGPGAWDVVVEAAPIVQIVDELKLRVDVPATNASYTFEASEPTVVAARDGSAIDADTAVAAVVAALEGRAEGLTTPSVTLPMAAVAPEFTTTDAQGLVDSVERLGRWTTRYDPSPFNGDGANIKTPARLINGTVVDPGETFDFIDAAGPFTRRNGYADGAAIRNGRTVSEGILGGGLCSASTTLFNAAARAGFQIDERHNHGYYIGRYPVGLDATIWELGGTRKSLRFTNDTEYPILIRGINRYGRVTFEIWGVSDGRTVEFTEPRIEDVREASSYLVYTDELPPGVRERVEWPTDGFDSWVSRTVRDANGVVLHENTWFSDYRKVDGLIELGRYPDDPRAGTRVPAGSVVPREPAAQPEG